MDDMDDFECDDFDKTLKVIVVGNGNVGKTSMTTRYAKGRYTGNYKKTIGVDFMEKRLELRDLNETVNLMIWDTAGQEEFGALTSRYYKGAGAVIYVFSTTDRDSFEDLPKWQRKVEEECGRICQVLVQNKIDLVDDAAMTRREVEDMTDFMCIRLFRSCVQDNVNVKEVFEHLCRQYLKHGKHGSGDEALQAVADISTLSEAATAAALKNSQPSPSYERRSRGGRDASDVSDSGSTISDGKRSSSAAPSPGSTRDRERADRGRDRGWESSRKARGESDERIGSNRKMGGDDYDDGDGEDDGGGLDSRRRGSRRDERQRGWGREDEDGGGRGGGRDRRSKRDQDRSRERDRDRDYGLDRDREHGRDRDHTSNRDRERGKDRDRARDRDDDRDRDRTRSRGKDSDRDRDQDRERVRDRDRDRDRNRDRNRSRDKEPPKDRARGRGRSREDDDAEDPVLERDGVDDRESRRTQDRETKRKDWERDSERRPTQSKESRDRQQDPEQKEESNTTEKEASVREGEVDAGKSVATADLPATADLAERDSRQNSRSMRESDQAAGKDKQSTSRPQSEKASELDTKKKPLDKATLRAQLREGDDSDSESDVGGHQGRVSGNGAGKTSTAASESSRVQPSKRRTNGKKTNPLLHKMSKLVYG